MTNLDNLIIIDITDKEYTQLNVNSEISGIKGDGKLLIKNPSQKSRIWNLECDLKEVINTNIPGKDLNPGTINPGQEFGQDYEIQNLKEPCLKVTENFDTERDTSDTENNAFLFQKKNLCNIKLTFTNTLELPILDIKSSRELPDFIQDIEIIKASSGIAELKEEDGKRTVIWDIETLEAQVAAELVIHCVVSIQDREKQSLGALKVTYLIENHNLTMIEPEVRGLTDSMSGVSRDESSVPGTWDCNVEFVNDSEFKVKIENVDVSHKITTGSEVVVTENPNKDLNPNDAWDFDFKIETTNVPELDSSITFTPLFGVVTRIIGEIIKESTIYTVLAAEVSKTINPPEVGAYANTEMTIENIIPNTGTASIDVLHIFDEIPMDFIPPTFDKITLTIKNSEGDIPIHNRTDFIEDMTIEPDDQSPETSHKLSIKLHNLEQQLPPNSQLIMGYPIMAKNPKPETEYPYPVMIKGITLKKGMYFEIEPPEKPMILIKYIQRKFKTLKSIKPGASEGDFSITVRLQNKGDVELENILVKDKIPEGFSISDFTPPEGATHEIIKNNSESELQVKIIELAGGASLTLNYNCSGTGDYHRSEPQIIVKGRDTDDSAGNSNSDAEDTIPPEPLQTQVVSKVKQGEITDFFSNLFQSIDQGTKGNDISAIIEDKSDIFPQGPIRHQIMTYARELKGNDKALIGEIRDDLFKKLEAFRGQFET